MPRDDRQSSMPKPVWREVIRESGAERELLHDVLDRIWMQRVDVLYRRRHTSLGVRDVAHRLPRDEEIRSVVAPRVQVALKPVGGRLRQERPADLLALAEDLDLARPQVDAPAREAAELGQSAAGGEQD